MTRFDWPAAAAAADVLVQPVAAGGRWMQAQTLLDAAAVAYLRTARPEDACAAYDALVPATDRISGTA